MKRNAIVRILIHAILALTLSSILVAGLTGNGLFFGDSNGITVDHEASIEAEGAERIEINWAAGSIQIKREDVTRIIFRETAEGQIKQKMTFQFQDDTLTLNISGQKYGLNADQKKDLVIIVPLNWKGEYISINGAALTIDIIDLEIGELELNGASCYLNFQGSVDKVSVDGASANVVLNCGNRVSKIDMDGAGCKLDLTLPKDCGFQVKMDGLGCDFQSDLSGIAQNGSYVYGDQHCKIDANGLSCKVSIYENPIWPIAE